MVGTVHWNVTDFIGCTLTSSLNTSGRAQWPKTSKSNFAIVQMAI